MEKKEFYGEELLGPQASLRVTPCPPAPNHTRGEVIRPPSQIKNNSYSVIRTRDLGRCREFLNTGLGGRVRRFVSLRVQ